MPSEMYQIFAVISQLIDPSGCFSPEGSQHFSAAGCRIECRNLGCIDFQNYPSTGNLSSCFFFILGGVNFLMQLQFLAPVEIFLSS